jgi:hypothetical protein
VDGCTAPMLPGRNVTYQAVTAVIGELTTRVARCQPSAYAFRMVAA